jgi:thiol-disulfide isomerase/thioredoxin
MSAAVEALPRRGAWAVFAALLVIVLAAMALLQARRTATAPGLVELHGQRPAELGAVLTERGAPEPIDAFRGKTVILNLWAPWCAPCLQEMPSLDRLAGRLPAADFAVVVVTKDPVGDSASKRTFDRMGLKRLKLYLDPEGKLAAAVEARGLPTTLILDRDGAPLAYREGAAEWDSDAMVARLEALAQRPARPE